jgi:adenylate cyclase
LENVRVRKVHEGAAEVVRWMLSEGRYNVRMREFGDEMCRRIVAAGFPIWRGFCVVGTLHPQIRASAYVWRRHTEGAVRLLAEHGLENTPEFANSPITEVRRSVIPMRCRLEDSQIILKYAVLEEFRRDGGTDYIALPMACSDGQVNCITFVTDRRGGFTDADLEGLTEIAQALSLIVELQSSRRIARSLVDTYIGRRTGERVLRGAIRRGSGEVIRAVIWLCDLRGFTGLSERLTGPDLTALLNAYFGVMVGAVTAEGGEVLKFMGDGMLAIFELAENEDAGRRCGSALKAARAALAGIAEHNSRSTGSGDPEIKFGLALHLSEVYYGNIGAPDRLDFTVIGPAVNHAARLEKLGSELGYAMVTSASFAAAAPEALATLGFHPLRGVSQAQEVFTLDRMPS